MSKYTKARYLLVFYTNPMFGGHRELFYLPDGKIDAGVQSKIQENFMKYGSLNKEIDENYPYLHYFPASFNPLQEDRKTWNCLKILYPKPPRR